MANEDRKFEDWLAEQTAKREAEDVAKRPGRWAEALRQVDQILRQSMQQRWNRGSSRSQGYHAIGETAVRLKIWTDEGQSKHHFIVVRHLPRVPDGYKVEVEMSWSDNDEVQQERLDRLTANPDKVLIVNHKFYTLGPATGPQNGFGGRKILFKRLVRDHQNVLVPSALTESTTNLWSGGIIPPAWRDRLPDNAVFVDGFDGPVVMY